MFLDLLRTHGVFYKTTGETLLVLDEYTREGLYYCEWVNATNWTTKDALRFLGY